MQGFLKAAGCEGAEFPSQYYSANRALSVTPKKPNAARALAAFSVQIWTLLSRPSWESGTGPLVEAVQPASRRASRSRAGRRKLLRIRPLPCAGEIHHKPAKESVSIIGKYIL